MRAIADCTVQPFLDRQFGVADRLYEAAENRFGVQLDFLDKLLEWTILTGKKVDRKWI